MRFFLPRGFQKKKSTPVFSALRCAACCVSAKSGNGEIKPQSESHQIKTQTTRTTHQARKRNKQNRTGSNKDDRSSNPDSLARHGRTARAAHAATEPAQARCRVALQLVVCGLINCVARHCGSRQAHEDLFESLGRFARVSASLAPRLCAEQLQGKPSAGAQGSPPPLLTTSTDLFFSSISYNVHINPSGPGDVCEKAQQSEKEKWENGTTSKRIHRTV